MDNNQPKQILDLTFRRLDEMITEKQQEKSDKKIKVNAAKPEKRSEVMAKVVS